jgi:hypothetical protein
MEESSTYQRILSKGVDRGRRDEARRILLRQGRIKFGEPDPSVRALIEGIDQLERLENLGDRLLWVTSWQELLVNP